MMASDFEAKLRSSHATARQWEDPVKKRKALAVIPLEDLQAVAEAKFESSGGSAGASGSIASNAHNSSIIPSTTTVKSEVRAGIIRDLLLLELLNWFKSDFFTWTDAPKCPKCRNVTSPKSSNSSGSPTTLELLHGAHRVELYTCAPCGNREVRFPRYNDPEILLETRTGRCGEWANCFGLISRAVGFETRYILDLTDHVWVEVFSSGMMASSSPSGTKNRWLHCDPCENACDTPLLYEIGWGKKLSFVIGASVDDVQDVTWRYSQSRNIRELVARRNCSEGAIAEALVRVRKQIQAGVSPGRKAILDQRLVEELVEFILKTNQDTVKDSETLGRQSGSLAWRLAREETTRDKGDDGNPLGNFGYEWEVLGDTSNGKLEDFILTYDPVSDSYYNSRHPNVLRGWRNGTFHSANISRKEERDWKMVYLARQEGAGNNGGKIAWKFSIPVSNNSKAADVEISRIRFEMVTKTFDPSAKIVVKVADEKDEITVSDACCQDGNWCWEKKALSHGARSVMISVDLRGGTGNVAWQHAQLFRASTAQPTSGLPMNNHSIFRVLISFQRKNQPITKPGVVAGV